MCRARKHRKARARGSTLQISLLPGFFHTNLAPACRDEQSGAEDLVDILFVEDNPNDVEITIGSLKGICNRIQVVRDGQEALDYLFCSGAFAMRRKDLRPQLILLDLALPKIGGLEVLRRAKADSRTASIPVVVLTSSESDRDLQMSRRLGAQTYIVKPVGVPNLTQVASQLSLRWALLKPPAPVSRPRSACVTS